MADWLSTMQQTYEYYIVDPGTWKDIKRLDNVVKSSIKRDSSAETLGSATIDITGTLEECYIRIYLITIQNGFREKHPLGTFLVQTPSYKYDGKVQTVSLDAYTPLLELKEGDNVLDTCCAPGGKSAHILDIAPNVTLTCADVDEQRLNSAKTNLQRLNRTAKFLHLDFSADISGIKETFDKILVDAPCSGTGVIRRHPDIKWLRRQKDIKNLVTTQEKILDNAFALLNKGGILVYTTCSILKQENEDQVKKFLDRHKDAKILPFEMKGKVVDFYQRLPGENNSDGFFYSRFIKA